MFPHHTGPLTEELKRRIYQDYRRGLGGGRADRSGISRTRASIYRVINEMRAQRILELPLDYVYNESFDRRRMPKRTFWARCPQGEAAAKRLRVPGGPAAVLWPRLYEVPLLTREQEYHLFRQFNYLKYQASQLRERLIPARASSR